MIFGNLLKASKTKKTEKKIMHKHKGVKNRSVKNKESHITKSRNRTQNLKHSQRHLEVLMKPVITEKTAKLTENNVYTFIVKKDANKEEIFMAIEDMYGVKPEKINITKRASKNKRVRQAGRERQMGTTKTLKKAYVFLKKGDKIELI